MDPKRILFIAPQPFFQWRGSPIRVKFNLLALRRAGYEVDLLTLPIGEEEPIEGVRILRTANPFRVRQVPIGPSPWKLFFDALLFLRGMRLCLTRRYAVIHGVEEAGFLATLLAKIFRTRAIFEKHSDPCSYRGRRLKNALLAVYARVERLSARMADAVIATGPGLARQVEAMNTGTPVFAIPDIPSSRVDPAPGAIAAARARWTADAGEVLAVYVGSFAVYQGVDLLFQAIPEALRSAPRLRFVIIGGSPAEIEARRAALRDEGLADRVVFAGHIPPDQLPAGLAAADILISPRSSGVNTPLKVLDYLKAGRAIVATDIPANRLLLDEQTAVFCPPVPAALAGALVRLAGQDGQRAALGRAAQAVCEQGHTFELHCQRMAACYEQVLRDEKAPPRKESNP